MRIFKTTYALPTVLPTVFAIAFAMVLVFSLTGIALAAPSWPDASAAYWSGNYGVTDAQVATVADGYPDGSFRPTNLVDRGQFAKMAVNGLGLPTSTPTLPTFVDVRGDDIFYPYIEAGHAGGLIAGYPVGGGLEFRPSQQIQRQQANSILGKYLSGLELSATGAIHGSGGRTYTSLDSWYAAQGERYLQKSLDTARIAGTHRSATAYLVYHGVVQGSNAHLDPTTTLNRAQAAAMVLRVKAAAGAVTTPPSPSAPSTGGSIDALDAVGIALVEVKGGAVIEVERDTHQGRPVWEVVVRTPDAHGIELKIDVATGEIVKREAETLSWYEQQAAPKIDIRVAMATALAARPGTIAEIELDWEHGRLIWEVDIITTSGIKVELEIDANTGKIIR